MSNKQWYMEQPITQTLEQNFMPYAMSVIVSRALPEIDGFRGAQVKDGVILTLKSIVLVFIENYFHLFILSCCIM